jgi:hypothetical protein
MKKFALISLFLIIGCSEQSGYEQNLDLVKTIEGSGKTQKYINLDDSQIKEIQSWLAGSDLGEAWQEFEAIKVQEEQIKKELAIKKKAVMTKFKSAMKK